MPKKEDAGKGLTNMVSAGRLAHDFADEDEKKQIELLADEIIAKHPDIQKILTNQESMGQMVPGPYFRLPGGCGYYFMPCHGSERVTPGPDYPLQKFSLRNDGLPLFFNNWKLQPSVQILFSG